jgi:ubiquinone/menaquinone biosynthesis C-methylase UbiE
MDFHDADTLASLFEEAGFNRVSYKKFMFGTIAVHWGTK